VKALNPGAEPELIEVRPPGSRAAARSRLRGAGDRYSRRVAMLKRMLPALGVMLLVLVAVWPQLGTLLENVGLGLPVIDMREARELRMLNPRYAGVDRFGRPYVVTAAVGRQVPNRDDLMSLEMPRAEIRLRPGALVVVTAATAIYQTQAQLLDLFENVNLVHENGTRFVTRSAHVDVSANTAEGHDPVVGHGPSGDIAAEGFRIFDKGDTIFFTGNSHVLLKGTKPTVSPATPPTLPAEVQAMAAQIEAAASVPAAASEPVDLATGIAQPAPPEPPRALRPNSRPHPRVNRNAGYPERSDVGIRARPHAG
jgi:lipopolysaccharide export system protein LptC